MPLYSFLENTSRKFPSRIGAIYLGNHVSYSELWDKTLRFAGALQRLGIDKGDRVGLLLPNTPQFIVAFNAVLVSGGIVVPVNPLNPVEEIGRELKETECKILIVLDRLLDKLPSDYSGKVVVAEATEYALFHIKLFNKFIYRAKIIKNALNFETLKRGEAIEAPMQVDAREDLATILYTSGTTGKPKGVMLTHFNLTANALQSYFWLRGWGYSPKPQPEGWPLILCVVPFFHSYGLNVMNEAVSFGCTLVLIPQPKPEAILNAVHRHRVTHAPLIPRFVGEMIDHPQLSSYDLTSITMVSSGGGYIRPEHMKKFEVVTGAMFYQGYGLTEAGPTTHATPIGGAPNHLSAGLAYPDTEVKVVDLQLGEVELQPGREGELVVRGPQIMKGYWKALEETRRVLKDGWLYTGDIVRVDEEGWLYFIGRKRDRIVAGGHNVWPAEVEETLISHPDVEQAVAVGTPDPLRCNTDIQAFVVLKKGVDPTGIELRLIQYCRLQLQIYQVPTRIDVVSSLPMTQMGKIDRLAVEAEIERRVQQSLKNYTREHK